MGSSKVLVVSSGALFLAPFQLSWHYFSNDCKTSGKTFKSRSDLNNHLKSRNLGEHTCTQTDPLSPEPWRPGWRWRQRYLASSRILSIQQSWWLVAGPWRQCLLDLVPSFPSLTCFPSFPSLSSFPCLPSFPRLFSFPGLPSFLH